jgi:broad specificity phosphatase PhoE
MASRGTTSTLPEATIYLIRHGDRYDYADKKAWRARCAKSELLVASDPPLSALGHEQARGMAQHLAREGIEKIIVSPYLRALQTAQPLAHATGLPLCVDFAAAEAHQKPTSLPPLAARLPYFPEMDEDYTPIMSSVVVDGDDGPEPNIEPRLEHMRRMLHLAKQLPTHPSVAGKRVAIVTCGRTDTHRARVASRSDDAPLLSLHAGMRPASLSSLRSESLPLSLTPASSRRVESSRWGSAQAARRSLRRAPTARRMRPIRRIRRHGDLRTAPSRSSLQSACGRKRSASDRPISRRYVRCPARCLRHWRRRATTRISRRVWCNSAHIEEPRRGAGSAAVGRPLGGREPVHPPYPAQLGCAVLRTI